MVLDLNYYKLIKTQLMKKIILGTLIFLIGVSSSAQKILTKKQIVGSYSFSLETGNYNRGKSYLISIENDGTLTGFTPGDSDPNKPYSFSDDNSTTDKGTWKIVPGNKFIIYWSDIPKWNCRVRINSKGKVLGFIEDSGTFVEKLTY